MRTDRYMGMEGIGGMAGFGSLNFLKWQRCGTETSSDTATIAYVVCLKEQFYSVLTSLYKWVSYLFSFSLSLMESRCGSLELCGSPQSASLSSVSVNLLTIQDILSIFWKDRHGRFRFPPWPKWLCWVVSWLASSSSRAGRWYLFDVLLLRGEPNMLHLLYSSFTARLLRLYTPRRKKNDFPAFLARGHRVLAGVSWCTCEALGYFSPLPASLSWRIRRS